MIRARVAPPSLLVAAAISSSMGISSRDARAQDRLAETGATGHTALSPQVPISLESDRPGTRLVRFEFLGSGPRLGFYQVDPVCTAPCTAAVLAGDTYRIIGPGITPSPTFQLSAGRETDLHVRTGSWGAHAAGMVFSILGATYVPVGAGMLVGQDAFGDSRSRALVPIGGTFLAVGLVALAVGLPLWLGSETRVTAVQAAP
jgi:hypothetical protein